MKRLEESLNEKRLDFYSAKDEKGKKKAIFTPLPSLFSLVGHLVLIKNGH